MNHNSELKLRNFTPRLCVKVLPANTMVTTVYLMCIVDCVEQDYWN